MLGAMRDQSFTELRRTVISNALQSSGHSDAARAMYRVKILAAQPLSDKKIHVVVLCRWYDKRLLGALTQSMPGSRSSALDDAFRLIYGWLDLPITFDFVMTTDTQKAG